MLDGLDTDVMEFGPAVLPMPRSRTHHVTVILVSHDGSRWLRASLRALSQQVRPPDLTVAVDTGSTDDSRDRLTAALGEAHVTRAPTITGFATAVARGWARAQALQPRAPDADVSWIWVLHDDSAPDPDALAQLLEAADVRPDAGIIGPKVCSWFDHDLLLELGVSIAGGGRRETFLEPHERDQGQHDEIRDVLAVGSAGMLIRRDVWTSLEGFDPGLTMFREDVEMGMRARRAGHAVIVAGSAVVVHAQAGSHGRRELAGDIERPHLLDRASAIHVILTHTPRLFLPAVVLRLVVGSVGRSLGFLLGKDPGAAFDEVAALGLAIVRIRHVVIARRHLARTSITGIRSLRPYLPTTADAIRHAVDIGLQLVDRVSQGVLTTTAAGVRMAPGQPQTRALQARRSSTLTLGDDSADLASALVDNERGRSWPARLVRMPAVVLVVALVLSSLVAMRSLWGSGVLTGGALLPVPARASDLAVAVGAGWHDVGMGSTTAAPMLLALLSVASLLVAGSVSSLITLLLAMAVPLAALSAVTALRAYVPSRRVRIPAALAYALLPATTAAQSTGRIGTVLFAIAFPWWVRLGARLLLEEPVTWRRTWATGLYLAAMVAALPWSWLASVVVIATTIVMRPQVRSHWVRIVAVLGVPIAVLLPWSIRLFTEPLLMLSEPGRITPDLLDVRTTALEVTLLDPGGPGTHLFAGSIVIAACGALLRRATQKVVRLSLLLGAPLLIVGVAQSLIVVRTSGSPEFLPLWSGPATIVWGAACIGAVVLAADGLIQRLSRLAFSWRQAVTALIALTLLLAHVAAALIWLRGQPIVSREGESLLPEYIAADLGSPERPRTLVLQRQADGTVAAEFLTHGTPSLVDADVRGEDLPGGIQSAVADLAAGRGGPEMSVLADHATRYVVLVSKDTDLSRALDNAVGLRRVSGEVAGVWRATLPDARARLVDPRTGDTTALPVENARTRVPFGVRVATVLPASVRGPIDIHWAHPFDGRWVATLDGQVLRSRPSSTGATLWRIPPGLSGGALTITRDDADHRTALTIGLTFLGVVILLALPGRRPQDDPDAAWESSYLESEEETRT